MSRSFLLVESKVAQANFFLGRLVRAVGSPFEFHCYLSAFVAACRSVTYVLQAVMSATPGFAEWYAAQQARMKGSPVARYFHAVRRLDHHVGTNPLAPGEVAAGGINQAAVAYSFTESQDDGLPPPPGTDVLAACHAYYDEVAFIVAECCVEFRIPVDPKVHFTRFNFESLGQSLSDALEELTGSRDATLMGLGGESNQWLLAREAVWATELLALYETLRPSGSSSTRGAG
jgi:hypothetical protein